MPKSLISQGRQETQDLYQMPLTDSWQPAADVSKPICLYADLGSELLGFLETGVHQVVDQLYRPPLL